MGFASDRANNVWGKNNSCYSRIKEENPNIVQVKCVMHSLALSVQWGFEKLPSSISTVIQKIPAHFAYSGIRRDEFMKTQESFLNKKDFQEFADFVQQERMAAERAPNTFQRYSATRFLVRGPILKKLYWTGQYFKSISPKRRRLFQWIIEEISGWFWMFWTTAQSRCYWQL